MLAAKFNANVPVWSPSLVPVAAATTVAVVVTPVMSAVGVPVFFPDVVKVNTTQVCHFKLWYTFVC